MSKLGDLIREIFPRKSVIVNQSNRDGHAELNNNDIANIMNKNINNTFIVGDPIKLEEVYESVINNNSSLDLKEEIIPIETLISQGKFKVAIQKYEKLIESPKFLNYSKDERFLIYKGIFNCHLNNDSSEEVIDLWSHKIRALGEVKEIHRYYFLLGVREYNNHNLENALIYARRSVKSNPNYIKGLALEILLRVSNKEITYDESKNELRELLKKEGLGVEDYATIYSCFGDIAFNSGDYTTAQEQYIKSNKHLTSLAKKIGIAVCDYLLSFKELNFNKRIELDKIDFDRLAEAERKFRNIYSERNKDTIHTIVNLGLNYYISILALNDNYNDILQIYSEIKDLIDDSMTDVLQHIAEAQAIYEVFDEELVSRLGEYEKIKFEVLYYERIGNSEKVIELLTPILDSKYKDEKVFQLSYLVALQESDDFSRYMYFYQKFNGNEDEVMRMNYIQFLDKRGEKEKVLDEIKILKSIVKNGYIIFELMLLYIDYKLNDELNELFIKVDSGEYNIIGFQRPKVFFEKMFHMLRIKNYKEYFKLYEETDLSFLGDQDLAVLKINYYMFKHDFENLACAYYECFKVTNNHNDLIMAVQTNLQINQYYDADYYLKQVNSKLLDLPEYYFMFKAIILKEMYKDEDGAFKQLEVVLEKIDIKLDSPFHQFYVAFNIDNNRTDVGFRYMGEYYAKNPNPNWFKIIKYSESDSGLEIIKKIEDAVGGKRDLSEINRFYSLGALGTSVYNKIVGNRVEEILLMKQYPFTRIPVSRGINNEVQAKMDIIDDKIIVDSTTLIILASVDALLLLDVFNEVIIPYTTITRLTENKSGKFSEFINKALEYLSSSPRIKRVGVDEAMKIDGEDNLILCEDILDCISLSSNSKVPYLNTEVAVEIKYKFHELIDINSLFFYLKAKHNEHRRNVSKTIFRMKELGYDFINFDADDMLIAYESSGVDGIKPFLKMGKNADYKTFSFVYASYLNLFFVNKTEKEFLECSRIIIEFMDKYIGKTKYYTESLIRQFPNFEDVFSEQLYNPTIKNIMFNSALALQYKMPYLDTHEMNKLKNIASGFVFFIFQYLSIFKEDKITKEKYVKYFKECCSLNGHEDIDYVLQLFNYIN